MFWRASPFTFFLFGVACLSTAGQARTLPEIMAGGVLRLATTTDAEPISYLKDGKLAGFDYELGQHLAKSMNLKTQWVVKSFDALSKGLASDEYDVVISTQVIDETRKDVEFTDPYYCTAAVLVARQPELLKAGPKMQNKSFAVQAGTSYQRYVQQLPYTKRVKVYGDAQAALLSVAVGNTDVTITDKYVALRMMLVYGKSPLSASGPYREEQVGMTVNKGNDSLRVALNTALATVMKNGSYRLSSMLAFHEDARCIQ